MMRRDEAAVSNVLGAVLMFGLLVLTLVTIQVRFVPVWDEDREARHMAELQDQVAQIKSDLDRQAGNDTAGSMTNPLTLRRSGGFQFFSGAELGATVSFQPSPVGTGVSVSSTNPVNILLRNGQSLFGLDTDWPDFVDDEIENVASIQHMRMRVDLFDDGGDSYIGGAAGNNYDDGDKVTLNVYDATDDTHPVGAIVTSYKDFSSEVGLLIQVFDCRETVLTPCSTHGTEISSDAEALFQQSEFEQMYFDLLDGALFFEPILASSQPPFRLELIEDGLIAEYQIAYSDPDSGGIAGGAGLAQASFASSSTSGVLQVEARNERYVDQTYVLEHGAVILVQDDGASMAVPPAFGVASSASFGSLVWTVPGLAGDAESQSGDRSLNVIATPEGEVTENWLTASVLTLDIPTAYAAA
jgi:hypothetical protein